MAGGPQTMAPPALLREMNRAFSGLNYDGVFTYYTGNNLATLRIVHMLVDGERRERLVHLNGAPRELIRRGSRLLQLRATGQAVPVWRRGFAPGPLTQAFSRSFQRIPPHYTVADLGVARVLGRPARQLAIRPRDSHRYGYRLWLDGQHRLLLRSELLDQNGQRLEMFQFTQLAVGDAVLPEALEPESRVELTAAPVAPAAGEGVESGDDAEWLVGWTPDGFVRSRPQAPPVEPERCLLARMLFTDGLAAWSLFVEPMPATGAARLKSRHGATLLLAAPVSGPAGQEALATLVGEMPEPAARRILASVRHRSVATP